jgi:hypothetical protein
MENHEQTRHDLEAKIVRRCWQDEEFRKDFTADPTATFVKYLHVPAANLPKIAVHHEEPGSWHIVLPQRPLNVNELSEQDLEKIAGGTTISILISVSVAASAVVTSVATSAAATVNQGW